MRIKTVGDLVEELSSFDPKTKVYCSIYTSETSFRGNPILNETMLKIENITYGKYGIEITVD
jgi:hypothetical protein